MSEQMTVSQMRDVKETALDILPILNQEEYNELYNFFDKVLDRYKKEHYPDMSEVSE